MRIAKLLGSTNFLEQFGDVLAHFVLPEGPIVAALWSPIINGVVNLFIGKNLGEAIGRPTVLPGSGAGNEVNIAGSELLVIPGVGEIREIVDRVIEIKIAVIHAVHEILQVVHPGHGKTALENVGVLEE